MKSKQFLKEGFVEDAHEAHMDHEVQMARVDCYYAAEHAMVLHKLLRNISEEQGLEGWVAAKITLANDYLKSVREHLEYQMMSSDAEEDDFLPLAESTKSNKKKINENLSNTELQKFERGPWYIIISGEVVPDNDGTPKKFNWLNAAKSHFKKMLDDDPKTAAQLKSEYDKASDKKSVIYYSKKLPTNNTPTQSDTTDEKVSETSNKPGLWANIRAKRERIKSGSGERMRAPGSKGAPSDKDLKSIRASSVKEGWQDEFADMVGQMKKSGRLGMPKSNYNFKTPEPKSKEELMSRLKELEAEFDPAYQQSDDYSFWKKQNDIASEISSIRRQLRQQGVAEGSDENFKSGDKVYHSGRKEIGTFLDYDDRNTTTNNNAWVDFDGEGLMVSLDRLSKAQQGVAEGLGKDIKRLATGKDVKSRAGQEIAKSQDASMKGDTKTSKKHFDRYDKLDKLANKEQGVAEGSEEKEKDILISTLNSFGYYTEDGRVYVNDNGDKIVRVGSEWKHQSGKRGRGAEELGSFLSSNQGVAEGSLNEFASDDSGDDGYYKEYMRGYKDGKGYPEVVKSSKNREIWMTVTPKKPPLTEPYMRGWYDGKYGPSPGKDLINLDKLREQGVAEGKYDLGLETSQQQKVRAAITKGLQVKSEYSGDEYRSQPSKTHWFDPKGYASDQLVGIHSIDPDGTVVIAMGNPDTESWVKKLASLGGMPGVKTREIQPKTVQGVAEGLGKHF
jgi:hypothetical protein